MENTPFVVIGVPTRDCVHLVVTCPFCGDIHFHGAGTPGGTLEYGPRVPHCLNLDAPGYTIVPAPSAEIEERLRESLKKKASKKGMTI